MNAFITQQHNPTSFELIPLKDDGTPSFFGHIRVQLKDDSNDFAPRVPEIAGPSFNFKTREDIEQFINMLNHVKHNLPTKAEAK